MMKKLGLVLLCLTLAGCTAVGKTPVPTPAPAAASAAIAAGLTVEEQALMRDGEHGISGVRQVLVSKPEILAKRKQWRDQPMTDGVALHFSPEQQQKLLHYPVKVGDAAVYVRANEKWEVEVVQDDKVLYTYRHPDALRMTSASVMVKGFTAWDGKWVLETVDSTVIVGGESLNDRLGYKEIFNFRMIAGQPFFFFVKDGKVRVSYDGQVLPQQYDKVPHYGCCDSADFNPQSSEQITSFFGLRDGQWYYVDMGVYN